VHGAADDDDVRTMMIKPDALGGPTL
jgi:hypothetical protein